jgi:hypothetical protein
LFLRQVQQCCQPHKAGDEFIAGGGIRPQDITIFIAVTIGVLDGRLGFADTTQAADRLRLRRVCWIGLRLRQGRGFVLCEIIMELLEQFFAPCKEWVALVGNIPG